MTKKLKALIALGIKSAHKVLVNPKNLTVKYVEIIGAEKIIVNNTIKSNIFRPSYSLLDNGYASNEVINRLIIVPAIVTRAVTANARQIEKS